MVIFILFYYKHQSRQYDSPIFTKGIVYQWRSGLENTNYRLNVGEFGDNSYSLVISSAQLWYKFCLWSQQVDIVWGKDNK